MLGSCPAGAFPSSSLRLGDNQRVVIGAAAEREAAP